MELLQFLLLFLCLIPVAYLSLHKLSKFGVGKPKLPPGNIGWPLIGETFDYYSKLKEGLMYNFLTERWNKYSSTIFKTSLIGETMVVFSNVEGNKFLFSNEKKLVQLWFPSTMDKIFPKTNKTRDPNHLYRMRIILRSITKTDVLREYVGIIDEVTKEHLQREWNCKQVISVCDVTKRYLFNVSCNIFLGVNDPEVIEKLGKGMENIEEGIHSMPINLPGTAMNRAVKAARLIRRELGTIIRLRRTDLPAGHDSSTKKNFLSHMLMSTDENGEFFRDEDIASHLTGILVVGYSAIHSTISNVVKYLAEVTDVYHGVLREQRGILDEKEQNDALTWEDVSKMKYSWSVACEVLRILTPGPGGFREAITDFTCDGYIIPKGYKIHYTFARTHMNPKYFLDPEKFDPSRFQGNGPTPYAFVPFGGGPRMCPGNEYVRIIIVVLMHNLVTHFRWDKLIPDEKMIHHPAPRPAQGLPVILHPHEP